MAGRREPYSRSLGIGGSGRDSSSACGAIGCDDVSDRVVGSGIVRSASGWVGSIAGAIGEVPPSGGTAPLGAPDPAGVLLLGPCWQAMTIATARNPRAR